VQNLGWFEIPINDMDRAKQFCESVFDVEVKVRNFEGILMGWLPSNGNVYVAKGVQRKRNTRLF
jgi:predicted enzyme related to lactoylglutathione lyase